MKESDFPSYTLWPGSCQIERSIANTTDAMVCGRIVTVKKAFRLATYALGGCCQDEGR